MMLKIACLVLAAIHALPALKTIALTDLVGIPFLIFVTWKAFAA